MHFTTLGNKMWHDGGDSDADELPLAPVAKRQSVRPVPFLAAIRTADDAADTAKAFDELEAWIRTAPSQRSVWTIDRMHGKWRVGVSSGDERYSASQDAELRGAIRNALMIAKFAGCI